MFLAMRWDGGVLEVAAVKAALTADATGIRASWPLGLVCNPGTRRLRNHFTIPIVIYKIITI
jgi:hypothetical protein